MIGRQMIDTYMQMLFIHTTLYIYNILDKYILILIVIVDKYLCSCVIVRWLHTIHTHGYK